MQRNIRISYQPVTNDKGKTIGHDAYAFWLKQRRLTPDRFRKLAKLLEKVPLQNFCMESWLKGADVPNTSCGTTACIAGWATTLPFAKKRAVKLFLSDCLRYDAMTEKQINVSLPPKVMGWKNKIPVLEHHEALEMFFGLTYIEVENIFFDMGRSKSSAIKLLRREADRIQNQKWIPIDGIWLRKDNSYTLF